MRIIVDGTKCVGHGVCESFVPEVFAVNDDGFVEVDQAEAEGARDTLLRRAVDNCPSAALRFES